MPSVTRRGVPSWIELDKEGFNAVFRDMPVREELTMPIREQLVPNVAGIVMSFPAAQVNWGGIFLAEPRMRAGLNNIALALIVLVATSFVRQVRANGLLAAGLAIFLAWSTYTAPLVLHPSNPIGTSPSPAIKLTFAALLALCVAASAWIVWRGSRQPQAEG